MVLQINGQDIWKVNADKQIRFNWQFWRILEALKIKFQLLILDEQIKYDKNKNILITHLKMKNYVNKNNEFWSKYYKQILMTFQN